MPAGWRGGTVANVEERYALLELLGLAGELLAGGRQLLGSGGILLRCLAELAHGASNLHH
jgi:hypothetical protein